MKAVLISIQPKWCELIASGKKTVEVRKTKPKLATPFKVYIYCTLPPKQELFTHGCIREYANELIRLQDGRIVYDYGMRLCCDIENRPYSQDNFLCRKVIGEFVCDDITRILSKVGGFILEGRSAYEINTIARASCLDFRDMADYFGATEDGYAWHISDLVIYDKPKKLSEYYHECNRVCVDTKKKIKCERIMVDGFSCNGLLPITRPPQSWCYAVKGD